MVDRRASVHDNVESGIDRQACGGTHLSNTAQSAPFRITKVENKGKRNRRIRFQLD